MKILILLVAVSLSGWAVRDTGRITITEKETAVTQVVSRIQVAYQNGTLTESVFDQVTTSQSDTAFASLTTVVGGLRQDVAALGSSVSAQGMILQTMAPQIQSLYEGVVSNPDNLRALVGTITSQMSALTQRGGPLDVLAQQIGTPSSLTMPGQADLAGRLVRLEYMLGDLAAAMKDAGFDYSFTSLPPYFPAPPPTGGYGYGYGAA